jgi:hypothetical protein
VAATVSIYLVILIVAFAAVTGFALGYAHGVVKRP